MVSIDSWSLCRGVLVLLEWFPNQPVVIPVSRWSFCRGVMELWDSVAP